MAQATPTSIAAELEAGKQLLATLTRRKAQLEGEASAVQQALQDAKAKAKAAFGTDDVVELRKLYEQRLANNNLLVKNFTANLQAAQEQVHQVESKLRAQKGQ